MDQLANVVLIDAVRKTDAREIGIGLAKDRLQKCRVPVFQKTENIGVNDAFAFAFRFSGCFSETGIHGDLTSPALSEYPQDRRGGCNRHPGTRI